MTNTSVGTDTGWKMLFYGLNTGAVLPPVTRYAKSTASFLAAVTIRCLVIWLKIS